MSTMMSNPISAENFSQIYASLETLDVTEIVSSLLKVTPLKEEILRRIKPRRKRRTKAEMKLSSPECEESPPPLSSYMSEAADASPELVHKKSRKSKPAKLNNEWPYPSHRTMADYLQETRQSDVVARHSVLNGGTSSISPGSVSSDSTSSSPYMHPLFNSYSPDIHQGFVHPTIAAAASFHPYWNMYRLAANQLLSQGSRFQPFTAEPPTKSADAPSTCVDLRGVESSQKETGKDNSSDVKEEEETIDIVNEDEDCGELSAQPGEGQQAHVPTPHRGDSSTPLTDINCPDCGLTVLLSSLTLHIQRDCLVTRNKQKMSGRDKPETEVWQSCTFCTENVPAQLMAKHIKKHHSTSPINSFQCNICSEAFRNKSGLKRHKISHTEGGGHKCTYCAKIFAKPELLRRHELLHTELKRTLWPCTKCNKSFSNKYNLAVHDRMHTGELPFACPQCPERFRVKCSMQNHLKSKHGQKSSTNTVNSGDCLDSSQAPCKTD